MNGFGHLPSKIDQNTFVFYANAATTTSGSFQAWNVPEYASFLHFTVIGSGGGGGGGGSAGNAFGGSGGAPGGVVAVSIPTILLPKTLYLQVGLGGTGGEGNVNANGSAGTSGTISYVCLYPETNPGSILVQSSNTSAGGGPGGTSLSAQLAAATNIVIADTANLKWLGIVGNTVAQTSGVTVVASSITYAGLLTGGAAGGTRASTGGNQIMTSVNACVATNINGGAAGVSSNGSPGNNGYFSWKPFIATGGAGGGGGATGIFLGGQGGKGAFGCGGGGGGGSGQNVVAGARGGDGGDGLIIIAVS